VKVRKKAKPPVVAKPRKLAGEKDPTAKKNKGLRIIYIQKDIGIDKR
jgi:hypothetical protein